VSKNIRVQKLLLLKLGITIKQRRKEDKMPPILILVLASLLCLANSNQLPSTDGEESRPPVNACKGIEKAFITETDSEKPVSSAYSIIKII
jgi:hypothetical protein